MLSHKRSHITWFHLYKISRIGKSIDRKQVSGCLDLREMGNKIAKGWRISFPGDEDVLKLTVVIAAHCCEHTKTPNCILHIQLLIWHVNHLSYIFFSFFLNLASFTMSLNSCADFFRTRPHFCLSVWFGITQSLCLLKLPTHLDQTILLFIVLLAWKV